MLQRIYVNSSVARRASTSFIKTRYSTGDRGQGLNVAAVTLAPLQNSGWKPTAEYTVECIPGRPRRADRAGRNDVSR